MERREIEDIIDLGISRSWLQKLCRVAFGRTMCPLNRSIWVCQPMQLMRTTSFDNTAIALELNYSEEGNRKYIVLSNVQKFIAFIIILSTLFCLAGCYTRVAVRQPQEKWWEKGRCGLKPKDIRIG